MVRALSQAVQSWAQARSVAVLAIVAFAVGIGSATALYTVVNGVLLKPLPYAHGERFVSLYSASLAQPEQRGAHSFPDLIEYQQRARSFDAFGWFKVQGLALSVEGQPQHVEGVAVTPSLAHNLGVNPILGQWFTDDTGIVISSGLWTRLGGDRDIVGKPIAVDGRAMTVAGVMPPSFRLPAPGPGLEHVRPDVWIFLDPTGKGQNAGEGLNFAYGRMKPGVSLAQAADDVKRVAAEIAALDPASHPAYTARLDDLRQAIIVEIRPTLILLAAAAIVLLLITCADVAGLLLSRAVARARETAIRIALGAGVRQLAAHYFAESLIISTAGAVAGLGVSLLIVRAVLAMAADYIPRADAIAIDWTVLAFAAVLAAITSALASLAPVWQARRTAPSDALGDGVRATAGARSRRVSRALVVVEIALAFTLLTLSVVLVLHLRSLGRVATGFNPRDLLTFEIDWQPGDTAELRAQQQARYISALEGIPGVTSAAFGNHLPLAGCCFSTAIYPEGRPTLAESLQRTVFIAASPGYFRTLEIPLHSGRLPGDRDVAIEPVPVVINEAAARANWPGQNAVGARGRIGGPEGSRFQVAGIVGDVKNDGLNKPTVPEIYVPSALIGLSPMRFAIRSVVPPDTLQPQIRAALAPIDPTRAIHDVATMSALIDRSVAFPTIGSFMVAFFAAAALLMATLGVYGVVSYAVRQGTVEIGTRLALGAIGRDLLTMIVGSGLRMAAVGAAIGCAAAIVATWALARAFRISDLGVLPFVISTAIIGAVTAVASFFPAWRATMLSPMVAIRNEPRAMWRETTRGLREAFRGASRALALDSSALPDPHEALLTDLVAAARHASTFAEAFRLAVTMLRDRLGASAIVLLERQDSGYRTIAAAPDVAGETALTLPADGFLVGRLRSYSQPLPLEARDLESWLAWGRERAPHRLAELEAIAASGIRLAVALRARDEILGVLAVGAPSNRSGYDAGERAALRQCGDQLALMIENARLTGRIVEQEKLRRDLALAAEVQKRLLPERPPAGENAGLAAMSLPARTVGGDYYDFLDLGNQRIGIALADVAGKGIAAALLMAAVQASLRIVASNGEPTLPQLAERINAYLHGSTGSKSYATFFYAQLDERSRTLRYVNAGHNPPMLFRSRQPADAAGAGDAEVRELNVGGTVLGLFPEMTYEEATVNLQPGDVLVAFTDGVTEALNLSDEEFGEARLKALLPTVMHLTAAEISARIAEALRLWIGDTAQYDDLTFVVLKVT